MATTDKVEWKILDTDLTTPLGYVPARGSHLYLVINEPGSGRVELPLDSNSAGLISSGKFLACYYRGDYRGGFFVEHIQQNKADAQEHEGRWMTVVGRGALTLLNDAQVENTTSSDSVRTFTGQTKAAILKTLIDEAQARGELANLTYDFTGVVDSNAVAWTDSESYSLPVGTKLLAVARQFARTGGFDFQVTLTGSSFTLSAYSAGLGSDISATTFFRIGANCEEMSSDEQGDELVNSWLVKYKNGYTRITDPTSISAYRRRADFLNIEQAQTLESATTYAAAHIALTKDPKKSVSVKVDDGIAPNVFLDYNMGDTVSLDNFGTINTYRVLALRLDFTKEDYADVGIGLNTLLYDKELRLADDLEWLLDQWNTARDADLLEVRRWVALGTQSDGITAIKNFYLDGNTLYVVGGIFSIGGITARHIASYNMTTGVWSNVGAETALGSVADLYDITVVGGNVYVVGNTSDLWVYDGVSWEIFGAADFLESVYSITNDGTYIYVSGNFSSIDSTPNTLQFARYHIGTDTWSSVDSFSGIAYDHVVIGSNLYSAGVFGVQVWDGAAWTDLSYPEAGIVYAITEYDAGFITGDADGFVYYYDIAEDTWTQLEDMPDTVRALGVYLADIYIGGDFAEGVQRRSGGVLSSIDSGVDGDVYAIALHNTTLIVGGDNITTAGGNVPVVELAAYFTNFEALLTQLANGNNYDLGAGIHNATETTTLDAADELPLWDSASQLLRKITGANLKTSVGTTLISDAVYGAGWNGDTTHAPSKNAIYDKIETLGGGGDIIEGGTGGVVGQVAEFVTDDKHIQAAKLIAPTGAILTLINASAKSITFPGSTNDTVAMLATANVFTAKQTISIPTATAPMGLGVLSDITAYNVITLNNVFTNAGHVGFAGGGFGDVNLYGNVPTGGAYVLRENSVRVFAITPTYFTFYTGGTADAKVLNSSQPNLAIVDFIPANGLDAQAFRVRPGSTASYSLWGDSVASFFEFHGNSAATYRIMLSASTTLSTGFSWTSVDATGTDTPPPINWDFAIDFSNKYNAMKLDRTGLLTITSPTTTTNAVKESLKLLAHVSTASTGSSNGFGTGASWYGETATDGTNQQMAAVNAVWVDATNASRKAKLQFTAYDTAARLGMELEANGSTADIKISADTWFVGSGLGLPYGSCYGNEIAWTQNSAVQNTWYKISDTDMSDGELNLVTHDGSGKLTVSKAGRYLVTYHGTSQISSPNKHILFAIAVNGTEQAQGQSHFESHASNEETGFSGCAILSLAVSATVEISIQTTDTGTPNFEVQHLTISVVQVGG